MKNLNTVKVKFKDDSYNYETSVSATVTEANCKEYFIGKSFDLGIYPMENFQRCIDIEFIDNNVKQ